MSWVVFGILNVSVAFIATNQLRCTRFKTIYEKLLFLFGLIVIDIILIELLILFSDAKSKS